MSTNRLTRELLTDNMKIIKRFLYNAGLLIALIVCALGYLRRKRRFAGITQRFFIPDAHLKQKGALWLHAVSVGEVNLLPSLISALKKYNKDLSVIISSITPQGYDLARKLFPEYDVIYFPFDFSWVIKSFIRHMEPCGFVAMETEIWPNLFALLKERNIPVLICNGRISDKAFPRYLRFRFLFAETLGNIDFIGAQSRLMYERFLKLGASEHILTVTGNMKIQKTGLNEHKHTAFIDQWSFLSGKKIIVAGSTHDPEEKYLIDILHGFIAKGISAAMIICPRHVERVPDIERYAHEKNISVVRYSAFKENENALFIVDTIGDLPYFYSIADVVFVGGSLIPHGGQNIIEPASFGKPIIYGPFMNNFKDISELFIHNKASLMVNDHRVLKGVLLKLLTSSELADSLAANAAAILNNETTAVDKNAEKIARLIFSGRRD